jgi:hypothetical protein
LYYFFELAAKVQFYLQINRRYKVKIILNNYYILENRAKKEQGRGEKRTGQGRKKNRAGEKKEIRCYRN